MWGIIWRSAPAKFKTGMCEMKILGLRFCGVSWDIGSGWVGTHVGYNMGSAPAKFKTGMCEMKILGSEVLWCVLGHWFKVGTHVGYNRDLLRQSSKQGCVR